MQTRGWCGKRGVKRGKSVKMGCKVVFFGVEHGKLDRKWGVKVGFKWV